MNAALQSVSRVNHYPKHIGDWMTATAHLSEVEECIYSRMLDQYYAREAALPIDLVVCCRLVRAVSAAARRAVTTNLREFFTETPDGWHQKRADEELAVFHEGDSQREHKAANERERVRLHRIQRAELFETLREAGIVPKWNATVAELREMLTGNAPVTRTGPLQQSTCNAPDTAYQNREPEPVTKGKAKPKPSAPPDLLVASELWQQFREARRLSKAPMTPHAEQLLTNRLRELQASGHDPTKVVEQSIERGWKGFFAVDSGNGKAPTQAEKRASVAKAIFGERKDDDAIDGTAERVA